LAIDVTITPHHLPITNGDDPSTYVASTINHHQQYERKKFGLSINTDNSYVLGEQVIAALNKCTSGKGNLQMIQKTPHFLLNFLQISTIFVSFSRGHAGTLQNHSISPCTTTV
jgi:hypothetical protein